MQKSDGASYAVSEAANGEDGLARIDKETFACVLLDYSLPGRNGVEILKRIRVKHPFVPVVMLTGLGNEKVAVAAMQEGAQNYISKATIDPQTLAHVIAGRDPALQDAEPHLRATWIARRLRARIGPRSEGAGTHDTDPAGFGERRGVVRGKDQRPFSVHPTMPPSE